MQKSYYHAHLTGRTASSEYIYGHQNFPLPITLGNPDDHKIKYRLKTVSQFYHFKRFTLPSFNTTSNCFLLLSKQILLTGFQASSYFDPLLLHNCSVI